jgi:hypothetical protein
MRLVSSSEEVNRPGLFHMASSARLMSALTSTSIGASLERKEGLKDDVFENNEE